MASTSIASSTFRYIRTARTVFRSYPSPNAQFGPKLNSVESCGDEWGRGLKLDFAAILQDLDLLMVLNCSELGAEARL